MPNRVNDLESKIWVAIQILVYSAALWAFLDVTRAYIGRPAAWVCGLIVLSLIAFVLIRRKKIGE